jgi:hypothetical protein
MFLDELQTQRVSLYVRSIEIPSGHFVDREGATHACARAGTTPFEGLKGAAHLVGRVFSEEDWQAINLAQVCKEDPHIEVEIVDISQSFWQRWKLHRQGIKQTPQFVVEEQLLPPITSMAELRHHL